MRDIKFRAWAFDDEFMIDEEYNDDDFVFTMEEGEPKLLEAKFDQINQAVSHYGECNHEIMQYTGLKDKNGVETYKKDIVKYMENVADGHFVEVVVVVDFDFTGVNFNYATEFEVIGNAYENPELNPELIK